MALVVQIIHARVEKPVSTQPVWPNNGCIQHSDCGLGERRCRVGRCIFTGECRLPGDCANFIVETSCEALNQCIAGCRLWTVRLCKWPMCFHRRMSK